MSNVVLVIVLMIVAALGVYSATKEGYCNCSGMSTMTNKPTYYVYRPFGDVSSYSADTSLLSNQFMDVGVEKPVAPMMNLGWKTGMPFDAFSKDLASMAYMGNNWAAGSDPTPCGSSVPLLQMKGTNSNGGYLQNYGSPCGVNANNMMSIGPPMLSNGLPQMTGPAGSFTQQSEGCAVADAYNLGIGVL